MKKLWLSGLMIVVSFALLGCSGGPEVQFDEGRQQMHIMMDGEHFATYLYDSALLKPVLWPVNSPSGLRVQRGYPIKEFEGESSDHRHHVGVFFTYGSADEVNGNSYWNYHPAPPKIRHMGIESMTEGRGKGTLVSTADWIDGQENVILEEHRTMVFTGNENERAIDFTFKLKAPNTSVTFEDTKEGMFAIRVADWLSEDHGTGEYLSSEGERTEENVWGKRAKWMRLEAEAVQDTVTTGIIIMNHPNSVNYPTFWHARGYGLFAANPLGQSVFQEGRGMENPEPLNFTIAQGDSAIFKYKMVVYEGHMTQEQIEEEFQVYAN